jgi:cytochrome c-type biogenesis protein CcmH
MTAEVGPFALIVAATIGLVALTAAVTVILVRRYDAARARARDPEPSRSPAGEPAAGLLTPRTLIVLAVGLVVIFGLAGAAVHFGLGRGGASGTRLPAGHPDVDPGAMIPGLEAKLAKAPDDPEGWRMLGWAYLQAGRSGEAAHAYGRAAALDPRNAEYSSAEGEATVLAAGGEVTPAALAAFERAVSADPKDPRALYYLALAKDQKGDTDGAMRDWTALLASAPPDAPWAPQVRAFVEKVARERHIDLAGRLPPASAVEAPPASAPDGPGPTPDQMAAASRMSAGDQQAMIAGMVARLSDRLRANPRDLDGWRRLMRARMVLGQGEQAAQAYRDGVKAFAGAAKEQAALRQSAAELGVPGI